MGSMHPGISTCIAKLSGIRFSADANAIHNDDKNTFEFHFSPQLSTHIIDLKALTYN